MNLTELQLNTYAIIDEIPTCEYKTDKLKSEGLEIGTTIKKIKELSPQGPIIVETKDGKTVTIGRELATKILVHLPSEK